MHGSYLIERRRRSVIIDHHGVEQTHGGATGAQVASLRRKSSIADSSGPGFFDDVLFGQTVVNINQTGKTKRVKESPKSITINNHGD